MHIRKATESPQESAHDEHYDRYRLAFKVPFLFRPDHDKKTIEDAISCVKHQYPEMSDAEATGRALAREDAKLYRQKFGKSTTTPPADMVSAITELTKHTKRQNQTIWITLAVIFFIFVATKLGHCQPASQIFSIQPRQSGTDLGRAYNSPFAINCGAGMSCSNSGKVFTITATGVGTTLYYQTVQDSSGSALTQRPTIRFSSGLNCTDATTYTSCVSTLSNPMTTLGDLTYGGVAGALTRLAGNTTGVAQYLKSLGSGGLATAPVFAQVTYSEIFGTPTLAQTKTAAAGSPLLSYDAATGLFTQGPLTAAQVGALPSSTVLPANTPSVASNFFTAYNSTTGVFTKAQPACGDLSNAGSLCTSSATIPTDVSGKKYIIQTADAALPNAQSLGALGTGLLKSTTTTGVLSIAAGADITTTVNGASCVLGSTCTVADSTKVPTTRTVNGKALSADITLSLASSDFANQGTTTTVLHGNAAGNPSFGGIVIADVTDKLGTGTKLATTSATAPASNKCVEFDTSGNLVIAGSNAVCGSGGSGMTNPMTTLGDIIYEDATPAAVRLAGNATTTKKYLSQTGNGSISAVPVWLQPACGDLSNAGSLCQSSATLAQTKTAAAGQPLLSYDSTTGAFTQGALTAANVGLGSVTNDAQTKAAIVPNTVPSATQLLIGNAGGTAYAPVTLSGPVSVTSAGVTSVATLNQNTSGSAASFTGSLAGDVTGTQGATVVGKVNGITYSATAAAHSIEVITTANTTATAKVLPDCQDVTGNHLNYTQSTDSFSCGTTGGAGGGVADPGANGVMVRTALNTTTARTLTGTANQITVTNGDGVAATPTFSLAATPVMPGEVTLAAPTTGASSLNFPSGPAPTTPAVGDTWRDTTAFEFYHSAANGGILLYDTTGHALTHDTTGTITPYTVHHPPAPPTYVSHEQTDACGSAICTQSWHMDPIVMAVGTSDFVTAANTTLQAITGLSFTFPANLAQKASIDCYLMYNQQTAAVADAFGIQDVTVAPTNINATAWTQTAATTINYANLAALTTTTATNIIAMTPSAITTVWQAQLHIMVEHPSNVSASVLQIMAKTGTAADTLTVKRGSYCTANFQ